MKWLILKEDSKNFPYDYVYSLNTDRSKEEINRPVIALQTVMNMCPIPENGNREMTFWSLPGLIWMSEHLEISNTQ